MKEYVFKYKEYNGRFHPVVPVILFAGAPIQFEAYVDSGASFSIFSYLEGLGIELEKGDLVYVTVGDGGSIPVYVHNMEIKIGEERFDAKIGFSKRLGIGFNILGRKGIFDIFDICFCDRNEEVKFLVEKHRNEDI